MLKCRSIRGVTLAIVGWWPKDGIIPAQCRAQELGFAGPFAAWSWDQPLLTDTHRTKQGQKGPFASIQRDIMIGPIPNHPCICNNQLLIMSI